MFDQAPSFMAMLEEPNHQIVLANRAGTPQRLQVPFTQEEIGDATGLTPVHVNRMLRQLTEEGLISRHGRTLEVRDWNAFREAAGFDKAYLHLAA